MGASTSLLLFGIGMMGTLFMIVLPVREPVGVHGAQGGARDHPGGGHGDAGLAARRPLLEPAPAARVRRAGTARDGASPCSRFRACRPSRTSGARAGASRCSALGVGAMFPAVTIGSMGSIRGQELGLGSGIVNMCRQVGFAIGIALFVAVFTGAIDNRVAERARRSRAHSRERLSAAQERSSSAALADPDDPFAERPRRDADRRAGATIVNEEVRDAYGAAFRAGALVTLLASPFALTMRRKPGESGRRGCGRRGRLTGHCRAVPYSQAHANRRRIRPRGLPAEADDRGRPRGGGPRGRGLRDRLRRVGRLPRARRRGGRPGLRRATPTWPCSRAAPAPG